LWKGLVDEGKLSITKLQTFMETVAGVELTTIQAKDLLGYMDANGDGRVGMEDFKNFLSIGRLMDTDVKSFMWEPKAKFRQENPQHVHGHDGEDRRRSAHDSDFESKPVVAPEGKAPAKRRPQPRRSTAEMEASQVDGRAHPDVEHAPARKPTKPPKMSPETEKKIEQALAKYEQQSWDKFVRDEKMFRRYLFEQFAGQGEEEMEVTEYHKMLTKWFPLSAWSVPRGLRPVDSLAALEYCNRRDKEDKGMASPVVQHRSEGSIADQSEGSIDAQAAEAAKMTYGLWLDVINGKHRPEEHVTELRH
jgi:hypothetical protein